MRKQRSDKGGHHNYPKRNKNVAADIKISNKQQLLNLVNANIQYLNLEHNRKLSYLKDNYKKVAMGKSEEAKKDMIGMIKNEMESFHGEGATLPTLLKLKKDLEGRRMVTNKALKLYTEMIYAPGEHLSREERGGKLMLNMLAKNGINVGDTTAIRHALGGYSPKELYDAWIEIDGEGDWYETLDHDDIQATLQELVDYLNNRNSMPKDQALLEALL